jgi:hypothetical protein
VRFDVKYSYCSMLIVQFACYFGAEILSCWERQEQDSLESAKD